MVRTVSHENPLEERYSHDIMIRLLDNGRMMKTELLRGISKSSCMIGRLEHLEEHGLVVTYNDTFSYNTKWVSLTESGVKVARLLKEIRAVMEGSPEPDAATSGRGMGEELTGAFAQTVEGRRGSDEGKGPDS